MQIPREPTQSSFNPQWGRDVVRAIRSIWPCASNSLMVKRTPNGTTFQVVQQSSTSVASTPVVLPFTITAGFNDDQSSVLVNVSPGTVSNLWPMMNSTLIANLIPSPPQLTIGTPSPDQYVFVYLENTITNGAVSDSTVLLRADDPSYKINSLDTDGLSHVLLGSIQISSDGGDPTTYSRSISQALNRSINYTGYPMVYQSDATRTWQHRYY